MNVFIESENSDSSSLRRNLSQGKLSSKTASVHSLLNHREADPEEVLHNLGFGGADVWRRIPERFLKSPSQVILCITI